MPSPIAIVGRPAPRAPSVSGELRFEPGTRIVISTANLPTAGAGIDATWSTTPASRALTSAYEYAEVSCYVDLAGSVTTASGPMVNGVIGSEEGGAAYLGQYTTATMGTLMAVRMECLEAPATGETNINLVTGTTALNVKGNMVTPLGGQVAIDAGVWTVGAVKYANLTAIEANNHFYLTAAADAETNTWAAYSAGKFLITFFCKYAAPTVVS